jgi:alkaline phosphatase
MKFDARYFRVIHVHSAQNSAVSGNYGTARGFDTKGYDSALVITNIGTPATSAEVDITLQEASSNTGASFGHVSGSSFTQATPTAASNASQVGFINLRKRKRYLRLKAKMDGTNSGRFATNVILFNADYLPATASVTVKWEI